MFNGTPKKLIIVGDKDTDVYCEYLSMLISVIDDISDKAGDESKIVGIADGSVDTAIWTDEIYRDNRAHTSSRQKLLFIGNKGCAKNIIPNINFENVSHISKQSNNEQLKDLEEDISLGIYYGWFGNKACIYVDDTLVNNQEQYHEKFRKKYTNLVENYKQKCLKEAEKKHIDKKLLLAPSAWVLVPFTMAWGLISLGVAATAKGLKDSAITKHEILNQAYRYAILKFYLEYLETFMG